MAADQERAERIRALKQERPDLTWRRIADHVGVTERSATDWQRKGGIEYDNAKKLAALFEVDVDYIWRGTESDTPTPFAGQDGLADLMQLVREDIDERRAQRDEIIQRLDRLEQTLQDAISESVAAETDEISETIRRLGQEILQPREAPPSSQPDPERTGDGAKKRAAKSRTP